MSVVIPTAAGGSRARVIVGDTRVVRVTSARPPRAACCMRGREMKKIHRKDLLPWAGASLGEVGWEHLR